VSTGRLRRRPAILAGNRAQLGEAAREAARRHKPLDLSALDISVLGLLPLMIGFAFAMALSRFDARRDALVNEINSIETTLLRARPLPPPRRRRPRCCFASTSARG